MNSQFLTVFFIRIYFLHKLPCKRMIFCIYVLFFQKYFAKINMWTNLEKSL